MSDQEELLQRAMAASSRMCLGAGRDPASRSCYAKFYPTQALLRDKGRPSSKHSALLLRMSGENICTGSRTIMKPWNPIHMIPE